MSVMSCISGLESMSLNGASQMEAQVTSLDDGYCITERYAAAGAIQRAGLKSCRPRGIAGRQGRARGGAAKHVTALQDDARTHGAVQTFLLRAAPLSHTLRTRLDARSHLRLEVEVRRSRRGAQPVVVSLSAPGSRVARRVAGRGSPLLTHLSVSW